MANVTVPRAEQAEKEGDSPASIALLYSVIFGSIVVVCAVLLITILVLKYVQDKHREADKGEVEGMGEDRTKQ